MPAPRGECSSHLLRDTRDASRLFLDSGFSEPRLDEVGFTWSFPDADAYWAFLTDAAGAIAMVVDRLEGAERELVRKRVAEGAERYASAAGIELPAACLVASAS